MKKFTLLSFVLAFVVGGLFAQNIEVTDSNGTVVNGQTVTVYGKTTVNEYKLHLNVKNTTSAGMDIKVRRYELNVTPNTKNYFCWSVCYGAMNAGSYPVFTDMNSVTVPGTTVNDSDFTAYHRPENNQGTSTYRYVYFDNNNTSDSTYVDVVFDIAVGMDELEETNVEFSAYPNPASDLITIDYHAENPGRNNNQIVLFDLLGKEIHSEFLQGKKGTVKVDVSDLDPGVYFYGIRSSGKVIRTKKLIINQ